VKVRLFYATDLHGSELTFRKFVSAGKIYKAKIMVVGGDITGKRIVPIVQQHDQRYKVDWPGERLIEARDLPELEKGIRNSGFYPYRTTPSEMEELSSDKERMERLFERLMKETLSRWCSLAEEHLAGENIRCFLQPGNDDSFVIDPLLEESKYVSNPEGKIIRIDDTHEMISTGYCNITPWNCPRDVGDQELSERIENMIPHVENMENCIFNFHCPPYDSGLDTAPDLDSELRMKGGAGGFSMKAAGSKAVRAAVEKYQPLLGLFGHIHEGRGYQKIGRTLCINPGSEYGEGILRGCIVDLDDQRVENFLLTSG
jgi:hypothetical protein